MVICDTNIISKFLERVPSVVENIEAIGTDNIAITPVILIEGITPYTKKNKNKTLSVIFVSIYDKSK